MSKKRNFLIVACIVAVAVEACSTSGSSSYEETDSTETIEVSEESKQEIYRDSESTEDGPETNELTDEYFTQVMGNGNTYHFSGETDINGNLLVQGVTEDGYETDSVIFAPDGTYLGIYFGMTENNEFDYGASMGDSTDDAWTEGEVIDTFGYPIMDYDGYWDDIALLNEAANGTAIATPTDYWYYTIPGYEGLVFYLSGRAIYDAEDGILDDAPYGVFYTNGGLIGEVCNDPIELTVDDYVNAESYEDSIIEANGNSYGFGKMGWIVKSIYNNTVNRLDSHKKQYEYEESKAESQQAALDNGYVPGGLSYEDIARYIDDYIGYKVSWDGGLVTDVSGDIVTVCASFDDFYGYSTPNYNRSFELDCSQASFDNGKPLVDDHILFEGTITGTDPLTNYIEVSADSVHVQPY